jgi:two-component system phosphate regulon sensor histidine kinase PhoR
VTNVSHEFKTPLTSIRGYTETLLSGADGDDSVREDFLKVIERNARHLESLVRDLLTLAKLEAELPATKERVDVRSIIAEHLSLRESTLNARGIEVAIDCPKIDLHTDPSRLAAAISNLIDNAINHNRPGGAIRVSGRMNNGSLVLNVQDSGYGIPESDLPRIFERFYRVDKARSRFSGGTGLGLAIAKHAVESQGGHITVTSVVGEGSTFTIHLNVN